MSFIGYLDKMQLQQNSSRPSSGHSESGQPPSRSNRGLHVPPTSIMMSRTPSSLVAQAQSASEMDTDDTIQRNHGGDDDGDTEADEDEYAEGEEEDDVDFMFDESYNEEQLMEQEHWSRGQLDLFAKVRRRGTYPVFPANWMLDFSNLPDELFVEPGEEAIVSALDKDHEVKAILAFDALMQMGGRIRDKMESGQKVEQFIKKEIQKYIDWAMKDGGIPSSYAGVFALSASPDYEVCEMRMQKRISELAERHRVARETSRQFLLEKYGYLTNSLLPDHLTEGDTPMTDDTNPHHPHPHRRFSTAIPELSEPPAANIYGFAIVGCVVAMVSLNTGHLEAPTRTLLVLDYSELGMDVWNAIAIALMVVQARNEQVERAEWGRRVGSGIDKGMDSDA